MTIRIFITGGTFDKGYNELNGKLSFKNTHLPELLAIGSIKYWRSSGPLMMIDSLEMMDEDCELIEHQCSNWDEKKL